MPRGRVLIVERDVAPVAEIRRPDTLRRLINQLAHRTAEELNVASLCAALGARKETVTGYLDVLSRLGIVHRLGAWTSSGARKEVKSPKLHLMDTGCHCPPIMRRGSQHNQSTGMSEVHETIPWIVRFCPQVHATPPSGSAGNLAM